MGRGDKDWRCPLLTTTNQGGGGAMICVLKLKNAYCLASLCEASGRMGEETKWGRVVFPVSIGTSPPSSVVVNTQGRESGGSGVETCSVAVPSAAPLWYGPEHLG